MSDTTGVVAFVYEDWITRFPEFQQTVTAPQASGMFDEATILLNNTAASIVSDMGQRTSLLYLLTAHMAQLAAIAAAAGGGAPLVGPIQSVSRGSVSITVAPLAGSSTNAMQNWLSQTQYGARFWVLTAKYRTMRYIPGAYVAIEQNGTLFPPAYPWLR